MITREIIEQIAKEGCAENCYNCPIGYYCSGDIEYSKQIAKLYLKAYPEKPDLDSMTKKQADELCDRVYYILAYGASTQGKLKQIYKIMTEELEPEPKNEWFVYWDRACNGEVNIQNFPCQYTPDNCYKIPDLSKYLNEPRTVENWEKIVERDGLEGIK